LICTGLNHDALNAHHPHRLLATQFAEAGYPALRFDYPQTGDSCDVPGYGMNSSIDLWDCWLNSIDQAADTLRLKTGAESIIVCGLRIGATLAAITATRRRDVAGVIMIAPVIKVQSYLRQIWIEAQIKDTGSPALEHGIRFQDICFNRQTVSTMSKVDLRETEIPGHLNIAMFTQSPGRLTDDCRDAWARKGASVFCGGFAGLEPLLHLNVEEDKEQPNFEPLLSWVDELAPTSGAGAAQPTIHESVALWPDGCVETPMFFGSSEGLVGILCRPDHAATCDVVIIANAGRDPRHGPGRFNVEFARGLAREGIASLRFDFAGLGDSLGPPGQENRLSPLFDLDRSADVSAAIDALAACGFRNFTAYGLCAGAYHVMRAAVADPRLTRLLLLNIPLFAWTNGERIDFIRYRNMPLRYFVAELLKLNSWAMAKKKLIKSGSVLRAQVLRLNAILVNASWTLGRNRLTAGQRSIATLMKRNTAILLLFGEGDLGLDAVAQEFGTINAGQNLGGKITFQVLPDLDHLVSHESSRRAAAQCMTDFLRRTMREPTRPVSKQAYIAANALS
jgi:pimeloyl-ACP methyl ester carboxylesterase